MVRALNLFLTIFKVLVALFMMVAGALTAFGPVEQYDTNLSFLYDNRLGVLAIGGLVFYSGAVLFWGKIRRNRNLTGKGLFYVYSCFFYAALLNWVAYGSFMDAVPNFLAAIIMGLLYLRWKLKLFYYKKPHNNLKV